MISCNLSKLKTSCQDFSSERISILCISIFGSILLVIRLSLLPLHFQDGKTNSQCLAYLLISYFLFFFYPPLLWYYPSSRFAFVIPSGITLVLSWALWSSSSESKFFAERPFDFVGSCMCFIGAVLGMSSIIYNCCNWS